MTSSKPYLPLNSSIYGKIISEPLSVLPGSLIESRNNPITSKFYPNWRLSDISDELAVDPKWKEMDFGFQLRIADQTFSRRCTYRALLSATLINLSLLDGIEVSPFERENGQFLAQTWRIPGKRLNESLLHGNVSENASLSRSFSIFSSSANFDQQVNSVTSLLLLSNPNSD